MNRDLLIEVLTEELPPAALRPIATTFGEQIVRDLADAGLVDSAQTDVCIYMTPRRLAVSIPDVAAQASARTEVRRLMPQHIAFDRSGAASGALLKRLEKEHASLDQIERISEGDTQYVFLNRTVAGMTLRSALQSALDQIVAKLPIPRLMNYQLADGATTVQFVRPAHGLIALHGESVIDVCFLGLSAGRTTHGHRFQGALVIELNNATEYVQRLQDEGAVIADFSERRTVIERELEREATALGSSLAKDANYEALLDEVTALVEMPTVYRGSFDREFLTVPHECLILTMRQNQRYFPLFAHDGSLTSSFLIVSNLVLADPRHIVEGNERVVRPRLADAQFFFITDQQTKLIDRVAKLGTVVYHNKLGTQLDRVDRLRHLAGKILARTNSGTTASRALVERAATLSKADLVTEMVGEFPELQGMMGRHYALHDDEPTEVADAIFEHYAPRFAGDALPTHIVSICLALADKLDTLVGMWGIGQRPTGEKDPYGLRRAALGVLRVLGECPSVAALDLAELVNDALGGYPAGLLSSATQQELMTYMIERMRGPLRERGFEVDEIDAVLADQPSHIASIWQRAAAVRAFRGAPEASALAAANKRIRNILKKSGTAAEINPNLLVEQEERRLYDALSALSREVAQYLDKHDYTAALTALAGLRKDVDEFFDKVLVNAQDEATRNNRLALLSRLSDLMNRVADISKLAVSS